MARVWVDELGRYLYDEEWEHYRDAKLAKAYMRSNAEDREKKRRKEIEAKRYESDLRREEEDRRMKLEKHCAEHGLDFDVENRKYVRKMKRRNKSCKILLAFGIILLLFGDSPFTILPTIVIFYIAVRIYPVVPDGFYDQIKDK